MDNLSRRESHLKAGTCLIREEDFGERGPYESYEAIGLTLPYSPIRSCNQGTYPLHTVGRQSGRLSGMYSFVSGLIYTFLRKSLNGLASEIDRAGRGFFWMLLVLIPTVNELATGLEKIMTSQHFDAGNERRCRCTYSSE